MLLGEIADFSKAQRRILSAHEGCARRSNSVRSTAKFFLISESRLDPLFVNELFTGNSRRDGSAFMNLLMIAPLCDSRGKIRYHIGAQVDVSGLVKDCTDLESLQRLVVQEQNRHHEKNSSTANTQHAAEDEFQELSEMLNMSELDTVRKWGGRMHREYQDDEASDSRSIATHMPRLLLKEPTISMGHTYNISDQGSGKLSGIYQNVSDLNTAETNMAFNQEQYLLIRPYPSLRILFASPTLRVPGILQSHFLSKIGGSTRVQDELATALAEGRGVTAKVRWVSKADEVGRNRWIHCTPLLGSNGHIGVWMIVLVDDDQELSRRWKQAPPVGPHRGKLYGAPRDRQGSLESNGNYVIGGDSRAGSIRDNYMSKGHQAAGTGGGSFRSASPNSVRIF